MKIAVLGAGMVGRTIAEDLSQLHDVTSFDRSTENLSLLKINARLKPFQCDLSDYGMYHSLFESFDLAVCAVPGFMGYAALETLIRCGKNIADISFFPEDALKLDALAKENNVTAITDCGVAPGMSNLIIGYEDARMQVNSFDCMVGGLPKKRVMPFEYKAPFSPVDVIEEYTRPARYKENGHIITRPALSDAELIDFEHAGTLESFNTDGLRSLLYTMNHIPDMKEKTLRYPGHIRLISALQQSGFFSETELDIKGVKVKPLDMTSAILFNEWKAIAGEPEFTIMKIIIKGTVDHKHETVSWFLYDEMDQDLVPSMSRTTGYACTGFVKLLSENIFTNKGVFPPELVGKHNDCFDVIMQHLKDRGINYIKTVTSEHK